jgi:hypothetical protein
MRAILRIDRRSMEAAGLIEAGNLRSWTEFRRDPYRWILRLDEGQASTLWKVIEPHNQPESGSKVPPRTLLQRMHHHSSSLAA